MQDTIVRYCSFYISYSYEILTVLWLYETEVKVKPINLDPYIKAWHNGCIWYYVLPYWNQILDNN